MRGLDEKAQARKAEEFRRLHHAAGMLVLPNIWDPLGARLLESLGYPAVATASAAVAYSLGYADGEKIGFGAMLEAIRRIAGSVEVPVTADVERGYALKPEDVAANVRLVLRAGAVGCNIEDSLVEGGPLHPAAFQCERIRAIREMALEERVPLVINARTDAFLGGVRGTTAEKVTETIRRANAYLAAGADCIYPIGAGDIDTLKAIRSGTRAPLNVYASKSTAPIRELQAAGCNRLSLGSNLLKASLATIRRIAVQLQNHGSYDVFADDAISSEELRRLVRPSGPA